MIFGSKKAKITYNRKQIIKIIRSEYLCPHCKKVVMNNETNYIPENTTRFKCDYCDKEIIVSQRIYD